MFTKDKKLLVCFSSQQNTQQNHIHSQAPLLAWGIQSERSKLLILREMVSQGGKADEKPEQPEIYDALERLDVVGAQGSRKLESVSVLS